MKAKNEINKSMKIKSVKNLQVIKKIYILQKKKKSNKTRILGGKKLDQFKIKFIKIGKNL